LAVVSIVKLPDPVGTVLFLKWYEERFPCQPAVDSEKGIFMTEVCGA
jgi:hypothetical protein